MRQGRGKGPGERMRQRKLPQVMHSWEGDTDANRRKAATAKEAKQEQLRSQDVLGLS